MQNVQKSILVIEDEPDIKEALADALKAERFRVYTAENGEVGLRLALANHPDLILLDLMMPVMDGHTMLERLRQDVWGKTAKVIVLSSMDDVANIAGAHEGRLRDYIIKSNSSIKEILAQVREHLYL